MHDDRSIVEHRLRRVLDERVRPIVHGTSVPLTVERWDVPGEPVPVTEGLAAEYVPAKAGEAWGPAWGTTWFRVSGTVPADWAGRTVEAVLDLGFDRMMPGFQCEGLVHLPDGSEVKALNPYNDWVRIAALYQLLAAISPSPVVELNRSVAVAMAFGPAAGLEIVDRLRPIRFTWKESGQPDIGLAAEEVAEVEPLLAFRNGQGQIEGVNYSQLTAVLVNALRQQEERLREEITRKP